MAEDLSALVYPTARKNQIPIYRHSPRRAGNSGAAAPNDRNRPANRPTTSTVASVAASENHGISPRPRAAMRQQRHQRSDHAEAQSSHNSAEFSNITICANRRRRKPVARNSASSPRRSTTLRNCTVASPKVPSSNPSPPRLRNVPGRCSAQRKIRSAEPPWFVLASHNPQRCFQSIRERCHKFRRRLDQKEPITAAVGKQPQEINFAHQQIALKNTVVQQRDNLQLDFAAPGPIDFENLTGPPVRCKL